MGKEPKMSRNLLSCQQVFCGDSVGKEFEILFPEIVPKCSIGHLKENEKALKKMVLGGSLQTSGLP